MSYTILSAQYANAEHTSAVAITEEVAAVALSEVDTPDDWAQLQASNIEIAPFVEPEPAPYWLYKSVFISRLSEAEAATIEAVLAAADPKLRLMFNSVEYFVSDNPLFGTLRTVVGAALGQERAADLLAKE